MRPKIEFLREYLKTGQLDPSHKAFRWATEHLPLKSPYIFNPTGRRLNHFCIGSDPEFCFVNPYKVGRKATAYDLGLKVGLAAGCDQNERLVELRPSPSTSVVTHVAGILASLRWMWRTYFHNISPYMLRAGAFFDGDGIGGHVHFGRKRPTRSAEIVALDGLASVLTSAGLFSTHEWTLRQNGDTHHQRYGLPSDYRIQRHGYEYRSLPSWLQSPKVAFIVLATSKLVVLDPSVAVNWTTCEPQAARDKLRGLAKLYRSVDDDAYILYHVLTESGDQVFEVRLTDDFSGAWGLSRTFHPVEDEKEQILPAMIEPTSGEVIEIQEHLLRNQPLAFKLEPKSFRSSLPPKYRWVPHLEAPGRRSGFGDLIHNLVIHADIPVRFDQTNRGIGEIYGGVSKLWKPKDRRVIVETILPSVRFPHESERTLTVRVPREMCQTKTISAMRSLLVDSGLFPIWTVEKIQENDAKDFLTKYNQEAKGAKNWKEI